MRHVIYGPGGYDPTKPDNNVIEDVDDGVPAPVPEAASPATIRVALRRLHGIGNAQLDLVVGAVIASLPDVDQQEDARTLWTYSVSIRRDHPLVVAVGAALALTGDQVDEVFRVSATV